MLYGGFSATATTLLKKGGGGAHAGGLPSDISGTQQRRKMLALARRVQVRCSALVCGCVWWWGGGDERELGVPALARRVQVR